MQRCAGDALSAPTISSRSAWRRTISRHAQVPGPRLDRRQFARPRRLGVQAVLSCPSSNKRTSINNGICVIRFATTPAAYQQQLLVYPARKPAFVHSINDHAGRRQPGRCGAASARTPLRSINGASFPIAANGLDANGTRIVTGWRPVRRAKFSTARQHIDVWRKARPSNSLRGRTRIPASSAGECSIRRMAAWHQRRVRPLRARKIKMALGQHRFGGPSGVCQFVFCTGPFARSDGVSLQTRRVVVRATGRQ